jgi:hypothetical protein
MLETKSQAEEPAWLRKSVVLALATIAVTIAIVVAALTGFLQFAAPLFGLTAALAMFADGLLQVHLRLVDTAFTLVIAIHRLGRNSASHQEKCGEDRRPNSVLLCHKTLRSGGVSGILHPELARAVRFGRRKTKPGSAA